MQTGEKLLSARELAATLGISPATVYQKVGQRALPCYAIGDRKVFLLSEVLQAIRVPADSNGDFENPKFFAGTEPIATKGGRPARK